jgi:MFS family permease
MPSLSFIAAKYFNLHGKRGDHVMSKGSGVLSIIGFTAIFIAPTPAILICGQIILSIGSAFMVTTRSLATSLVLPDHVGTLYSAIAIAQGLGVLLSGPLFANLFRLGMHLGNAWLGLPFLLAALFFVVAVAAVWHVKLEPSRGDDEEQEALLS